MFLLKNKIDLFYHLLLIVNRLIIIYFDYTLKLNTLSYGSDMIISFDFILIFQI